MTAGWLVNRTRELVQIFGTAVAYRDGFAADAGEEATPILPSVLDFIGDISVAGAFVDFTDIAFTAGNNEVQLDPEIIDIISVYIGGKQLRETSREGMDERDREWPSDAVGDPDRYFREGDTITLYPTPDSNGTMNVRSSLYIPDLEDDGDELLYVPTVHQRVIPYGAAVLLAMIDAENETHQKRIAGYTAKANAMLATIHANFSKDYLVPMSLDTYHRDHTTSASRAGSEGLATE